MADRRCGTCRHWRRDGQYSTGTCYHAAPESFYESDQHDMSKHDGSQCEFWAIEGTELVPVYIAHRLANGDRATNLRNASRWVAFLSRRYLIEPVCPWIVLASVGTESERALGLEIDLAAVRRCQVLIGVGPEWSEGMHTESRQARVVVAITRFGVVMPEGLAPVELEWLDSELAAHGIRRRDG